MTQSYVVKQPDDEGCTTDFGPYCKLDVVRRHVDAVRLLVPAGHEITRARLPDLATRPSGRGARPGWNGGAGRFVLEVKMTRGIASEVGAVVSLGDTAIFVRLPGAAVAQ
jgi:hypothetical protein